MSDSIVPQNPINAGSGDDSGGQPPFPRPNPNMLAHALTYARLGIPVFPIHVPIGIDVCSCKDGANCHAPGKRPHITQYAQTSAYNNESQITDWWTRRWPNANIATPTGKRFGIIVLDVDSEMAKEYVERRNQEEGYHQPYPIVYTSRGEQYYFAHPGFYVKTQARIVPNRPDLELDIRGDGGNGIAILPPSLHPRGHFYKHDGFYSLLDERFFPESLPNPPEWLLEMIRPEVPDAPNHAQEQEADQEVEPKTDQKAYRKANRPPPNTKKRLPGQCEECGAPTIKPQYSRCPECHAKWRKDRWLEDALKFALDNLSRATPGHLNNTLRDQSFFIGMIVDAGHLTEGEAEREIEHAASWHFASDNGKSYDTMRRALQAGIAQGESGLHMPDFTVNNPTTPRTSTSNHTDNRFQVPQTSKLPPLPQPELGFDEVLAKAEELITAEIKPPKRKIKELMREWAESAAYYSEAQIDELCDCLEELKVSSRERESWLRIVREHKKKVSREIARIQKQRAQITKKAEIYKNGLPAVIISDRQLRDCADECITNLKANLDLYVYGEVIARVGPNSKGGVQIYVLDMNSMPLALSRSMDFFKETRDKYVAVPPPDFIVKAVLNHDNKALPTLKGLTYTPILTEQGIEYQRGYLPHSQFYNACEFDVAKWALNPTLADLEHAKHILDDILAEFPFVTLADKANTIAMTLQQVVRPRIADICPLYVVQATTEGTGKTYLAECAAYVTTPASINPTIQAPKQEEEWRKQITTFIQSGKPFMCFDNVTGYLASPSLDRLLTARAWPDRLLGTNNLIELPITQTFALTANNVRLHKDTLSRSVFINLDANMEKPWLRTFRRDIQKEIRQNRKRYVDALITLVAWWLKKGAPLRTDLVTRFKSWEATIGGILETAEIEHFCGNMSAQDSDELVAWRTFVAWWHQRIGDQEVTASQLMVGASYHDGTDEGLNLLGQWIKASNERARVIRLGNLLKRFEGRVFNGLKIVKTKANQRGTYYNLVKV